uniref:MYND-type domain-containing protein n=1 Tax=Panagrolaimus sp. ES5 TaxID=591445 RepID=A0AC34G2K2_9BILA
MTSHAMEISTPAAPSTNSLINDILNSKANHTKSLENALANLIESQIKIDSCTHCGKKLILNANNSSSAAPSCNIVFCPDCKVSKYCSDEHLKADQIRHKHICYDLRLRLAYMNANNKSTDSSSSTNSPPTNPNNGK